MLFSSGSGGVTCRARVFKPGRAVWTELRASTFRQSCPKRERRVRPGPAPVTRDFPLCSGVWLFKQTTPGSTLQPAVLDREIKWTCSVRATPPCWGQGGGRCCPLDPSGAHVAGYTVLSHAWLTGMSGLPRVVSGKQVVALPQTVLQPLRRVSWALQPFFFDSWRSSGRSPCSEPHQRLHCPETCTVPARVTPPR